MSVQAGIWNFDGTPVDHKSIDGLSESLRRQGPDGERRYADGPVALLYRPFHTTAESRRETQPYRSRRGFVITWDGRLDNREELTSDLRSHLESRPTDVAIFAAAFDHWESHCFHRVIGDWAVSIWKPQLRELMLAVDYMAIRHIFYYLRRSQLWWSTDLAPLVLLPGDRFHVDEDYIAGYFAHDPQAHLTPYREIREVPPGQFVRIRNGRVAVERYWRYSAKSRIRYKTDAEYEEHFRHLFRESVRRRLRSNGPILAELSGGLDSSSIVCMADDIKANERGFSPIDTISYYDNSEPSGDDSLYFKKVEDRRGRAGIHIDGSRVGKSPSTLDCGEFCPLPGAFGIGDELDDERAAAVRAGQYRAVLSGIGGDEFMGGVPDPRPLLGDLIVQLRLHSLCRQLVAWSLVKRRPWIHLLWQSAIGLLPPSLGQYLLKEAEIEPWIQKDFASRMKLSRLQLDVDEHFGLCLPTRRSSISGVLLMGCKLAKFTPATSTLEEARYPFLDQSLIEFILSIPASQLLRPGERRSLMRRALVGIVPKEILSRKTKQLGARTPAAAIGRSTEELRAVFDSSFGSRLGYIDGAKFLETLNALTHGKAVHLVRLLRTISLELWFRDLYSRGLIFGTVPTPLRDGTVSAGQRVTDRTRFHHSC